MKWVILILSYFLKQLSGGRVDSVHPIEEMKDFIRENALKFLFVLTLVVVHGTMFTAGVVLTVFNLAAQYDSGLVPKITATGASGLCLIFISAISMALAVYFANPYSERKLQAKKTMVPPIGSAVEEALVTLINDYLKEREFNREVKRDASSSGSNDVHRSESEASH